MSWKARAICKCQDILNFGEVNAGTKRSKTQDEEGVSVHFIFCGTP